MHDIILGKQLQSPSYIKDDLPDLILVILESGVKITIVDAVHLLIIILLALQLIEGVSEGVAALLIEDPGILLVDEVVVQLH